MKKQMSRAPSNPFCSTSVSELGDTNVEQKGVEGTLDRQESLGDYRRERPKEGETKEAKRGTRQRGTRIR